jgi:hypothetical protein
VQEFLNGFVEQSCPVADNLLDNDLAEGKAPFGQPNFHGNLAKSKIPLGRSGPQFQFPWQKSKLAKRGLNKRKGAFSTGNGDQKDTNGHDGVDER